MQKNQIEQDLYVVQKIIGKKTIKDKVYYKVKWQGYSQNQCTWQKKSHLRYVTSLIQEYQSQETAFANTMKSSLGSYEDSSLSDLPLSIAKHSTDTQNGSLIAKETKSQKTGQRCFKQGARKSQRLNMKGKQEMQISSQEQRDNTDSSGSSQSCASKKPSVNEEKKTKQGKKAQKSKKIERKKGQASKKITNSEPDRPKQDIKPLQFQPKRIKGEEDNDKQPQIVIRLLESDDTTSDIRDYVVIYPNGSSKIYNTWELFYAHPVEFVGYLETKAKRKL